MIRIGTAGWALPASLGPFFPGDGSQLARFSRVFGAVEINSSFYRSHLHSTYARWAATVPEPFRFSVKVPKVITHDKRLVEADDNLDEFLEPISALGTKLGCILIQLPPTLAFDSNAAESFLSAFRIRYDGDVAVEPRHPTWFEPVTSLVLERYRYARVATDPAVAPEAAKPGGWAGFQYWRLHGSPRVYASSYSDAYLDALTGQLTVGAQSGKTVWCIFDNTMFGAAYANGLAMLARKEA